MLSRERFAILSDIWGRFRSLSLISPVTPSVGPGDDGYLWIDIGVDGTPDNPLWKVWDEAAGVWRRIGGAAGGEGMSFDDHTAIGNSSPHHAPVTLGGGSDPALSLSGQELTLADVLTPTEHTAIGDGAPHHAAVTLSADADTVLGLSGQEITLDNQSAKTVLAGPAGGDAAAPGFRALAAGDLPAHLHSSLAASDGVPELALNIDAAGYLSLLAGAGINEFSSDDTLADNSDVAVPTEKAVKTYIDRRAPAPGCVFLAQLSTNQLNITGDASGYVLVADTEVTDVGSNYNNVTGVFTAPATGMYLFFFWLIWAGLLSTHTDVRAYLITSNRNYTSFRLAPYNILYVTDRIQFTLMTIADMDIGDTAYVQIYASGGDKVVDIIAGSTFSGVRIT